MSTIETAFTRALLREIAPDVKAQGKSVRKDGWVWHAGRGHWEFHGPDDFYWHGRAGDGYEARYKGWSAWLKTMGG